MIQKKIKFRDANGNEIKELNYLVDYIDNSIEKYIIRKNFSVQTRSTKDGKSIYKNYNFSDYTDLWSLVKKIFEGKLSIKESRKQQNAIEKKITELHNRLNPSGRGKKLNLSTTKKQKIYILMKKIFLSLEMKCSIQSKKNLILQQVMMTKENQ